MLFKVYFINILTNISYIRENSTGFFFIFIEVLYFFITELFSRIHQQRIKINTYKINLLLQSFNSYTARKDCTCSIDLNEVNKTNLHAY